MKGASSIKGSGSVGSSRGTAALAIPLQAISTKPNRAGYRKGLPRDIGGNYYIDDESVARSFRSACSE